MTELRDPKDITIDDITLAEAIKMHGLWLANENEGKRLDAAEANLSNANLSSANLRYAVLCEADLYEVDLSGADLTGADLREA